MKHETIQGGGLIIMNTNMDRILQTGTGEPAFLHQKAMKSVSSDQTSQSVSQPSDSFEPAAQTGAETAKSDGAAGLAGTAKSAPAAAAQETRPLWAEVQKLGLWTSLSCLSAPLAAALSTAAADDLKALLHDMEAKGFSFSLITNPNQPRQWGSTPMTREDMEQSILKSDQNYTPLDRMTVTLDDPSKPKKKEDTAMSLLSRRPEPLMSQTKIRNFRDLKNLEAIIMKGDFSSLEKPDLANQLKNLEDSGVEFRILEHEDRNGHSVSEDLKNGSSRPVGLFGAYRALADDESDTKSLWVKTPGGGLYPLQNNEDMETIRFFLNGESVPRLSTSPLARRLRDLGAVGITFHKGDDYDAASPLSAYHSITELGYRIMSMSINGIAKEKHELFESVVPEPSRRLLEIADFYSRNLVPRTKQGEITEKEEDYYLKGLSRIDAGQTIEEGFKTIQKMREFEAGLFPELSDEEKTRYGVIAFNAVMGAMKEGADMGGVIEEYKELRMRGLDPGVSSQAIVHFRDRLKPRSFDEKDFREERESMLEIAPLAASFSDVPDARQALQIGVPEPYTERLDTLRLLVGSEEKRSRKWNGPTAMKDAVQDYLSLLPWPRTSLSQAAGLLGRLHEVMADKIGIQQSRDTYSYLQRGIQRGVFGEDVIETFAREFELAQDMDFALKMLHPDQSISEPYEVRADAARILREGIKDLEPRKAEKKESDDYFAQTPNVDEAAEDYRFMLGLPNRSLHEDASTLASLHKGMEKWAGWEERRNIFKEYKQGGFADLKGAVLMERLNGELGLSENLDVSLRALRGEYDEPFEQRAELLKSLKEGLADLKGTEEEKKPSQDYRLLLAEHCRSYSLAEEKDAMMTIHRALVPSEGWQGSRNAFSRLMKSLREGPWSGMPLQDATKMLLSNYLVGSDLNSALGSLEMQPAEPGAAGGLNQEDDCVVIGGIKLKIKS
jgi:hypothetical protein